MINFLEDKVSNFITLFSLFLHKESPYLPIYIHTILSLYKKLYTYLYANSILDISPILLIPFPLVIFQKKKEKKQNLNLNKDKNKSNKQSFKSKK